MHLLAATPGQVDDGTEPFDLGQSPADIVFISAADTELAALSEARADSTTHSLRLANLTYLTHPMSVDLHLDQCATKSKLVIAQVLGGVGYWKYGLEQYAARLAQLGIPFVALPGDDKPDNELLRLSSVPEQDWHELWAYLVEGGPENCRNFLRYASALLDNSERPERAKPLLKAGLYWPGQDAASFEDLQDVWTPNAPTVPIVFYRALVQGAGLHPINRLIKSLLKRGLNPMPVFVASLKDPLSVATLHSFFEAAPPEVILNCTSFAVGSAQVGTINNGNPLTADCANSAPIFQAVLSSGSEEAWEDGLTGLSARDIAMNVALPEVDGRILSRAISFKGEAFFDEATECTIAAYRARGDRVEYVADLAKKWASLRATSTANKRVGLILANYPNQDGRLANGVGLDTPQSVVDVITQMSANGFDVKGAFTDTKALMTAITDGPTNWLSDRASRTGGVRFSVQDYRQHYSNLPYAARQAIEDRWGPPEEDPFFGEDGFALSVLEFGNIVVGVQPARGYNIDPKETYHSPDLIPPHNYLAFYFWLRHRFCADVLVHMGKHGNLEWLPGKALSLSEECWPEIILGPTPNLYPFIINDPGEGTQAKRRISSAIISHLTPPLTRAETYGPLKDLEALVDEYYEAAGVDPRRINILKREILSLTEATGLGADAGLSGEDEETDLAKLDAYLCDLKEAQIRDGLHIFGTAPTGRLERDLVHALSHLPRGTSAEENSLARAIANDLELGFDPLDCDMSQTWDGPKPTELNEVSSDFWRSYGDTVERIALLSLDLIKHQAAPEGMAQSKLVLEHINSNLRPSVQKCGISELQAFFDGLAGKFIPAGPSGAPTRGRPDVLPTGKNFYSVDTRAVPTPTAWSLGWKSANLLIEKYLQDNGDWPKHLFLSAWGTSNMRTGGDDIAQALALMGVKPTWDSASRRVTGFEVIPLSVLDRPRVDITLRVSGFFRDAFPALIDLVDSAARAVMSADEPDDMNPAAALAKREGLENSFRVYGSKPGAYGAGLQALIDEKLWASKSDLAEAYLTWGAYAYGRGQDGKSDRSGFETRLSQTQAVIHNQDNREHDLLDSDDYYQFEGGAAAAVESLQGQQRPIYHNDHSRPERPVIRTLDDEIGRVIRSRVVNPKWIDGVKRHGYKGAFEMAATLDYLFAFSATTGAVKNHHFDLVEAAFIADEDTRDFIEEHNPHALQEMLARLQEAIDRGLWVPKSNSARVRIEQYQTSKN